MNEQEYINLVYKNVKGHASAKRRDLKILERQESNMADEQDVIYYGAFITEEGKRTIENYIRNWMTDIREDFSRQKNMHMMIEFYGGNPETERFSLPDDRILGKIVMLPVTGIGFYEKDGELLNIGLKVDRDLLKQVYLDGNITVAERICDAVPHIAYAINTEIKDDSGKVKAKTIDARSCDFQNFNIAEMKNLYPILYVEARIGCACEHNKVTFLINKHINNDMALSVDDVLKINYDKDENSLYLTPFDADYIIKKYQRIIEKEPERNNRCEFEHYLRNNIKNLKYGSIRMNKKTRDLEKKLLKVRDAINEIEKKIIKFDLSEMQDLMSFYLHENVAFRSLQTFDKLIEQRKRMILALSDYYDEIERPILSNDELIESIYLYNEMDTSDNGSKRTQIEENIDQETQEEVNHQI